MDKVAIYMYEGSPMFEVAIAAYILNTKYEVDFILDGNEKLITTEGAMIKSKAEIESTKSQLYKALIVCGGDIESIEKIEELRSMIKSFDERGGVIASICAGRDIIKSTLGIKDIDLSKTITYKERIVFSPPNEYAQFGIEIGKCLDIYEDDEDYIETIDFFIPHK